MQVQSGTGPGVRMSERPLVAFYYLSEMLYGNLSHFGKRSSSVIRLHVWLVTSLIDLVSLCIGKPVTA